MKRRFQGLASTMQGKAEIVDGVFLVRVDQVRYSKEHQKPFYALRFSVLEPTPWVGRAFSARLCCTPKTLWKFSWFLRDFGYDTELFGHDEIDDKALIGLCGVVKLSNSVIKGRHVTNLDAFATAGAWASIDSPSRSQVAS